MRGLTFALAGSCIAASLVLSDRVAASVQPSRPDVARVVREANRLLGSGRADVAVELLKRARVDHPSDETLAVALGAAYVADDNPFWALNVLGETVAAHPPACAARAWMAWIHLTQANLDQAEQALEALTCRDEPAMKARFLLLSALVAQARQQSERVIELLGQARSVGHYYEEDLGLVAALTARYQPDRVPTVTWDMRLAAGYTSNALSAAPVDERTEEDAASPVVAAGVSARAVFGSQARVRPTLEARIRSEQLLRGAAADLSFRQLALHPGVQLGRRPRLELRYTAEAVHWQGGDKYSPDGPLWYSEAHRGEFEIDASERVMAFGGAGYRFYRDRVRSRFEFDQGVAWGLALSPTVDLTLGGSARWYRAREQAYTQIGATGLAQLDVSLPGDLLLRERGSVSGDVYPYSEGYFPSADGNQRQELLLRTMIALWWPTGSPVRGAIEYSYTHRTSTSSVYEFDDHRLLAYVRWSLDSDRFGNTVLPRTGRVPLETESGSAKERESGTTIRELMRQDEAAQRGSSCLK